MGGGGDTVRAEGQDSPLSSLCGTGESFRMNDRVSATPHAAAEKTAFENDK